MQKLSICLLTYNSERTLESCLLPALAVADDLVVVDSGSTDATLSCLRKYEVTPFYRPYDTHARQMNFAIDQALFDWVLCLDSDEILDEATLNTIRELKPLLDDPGVGYRIERYWHVLGRPVRAMYPVSSPDYPVRLFNRTRIRFNDLPVDDRATGAERTVRLPSCVTHDTFFSLHELFSKLNTYTSRLVRCQHISPSLVRACISPSFAFLKWYLRKGAWRDGAVGFVTAIYAATYTFLKYFKSWCRSRNIPLD